MAKLAAYTALLGALIWMVFAFAEKGDPEDFGLQAGENAATEPPAKAHASIVEVLVQHCEAIPFSNAESLSISGSYFSVGVRWDMTRMALT